MSTEPAHTLGPEDQPVAPPIVVYNQKLAGEEPKLNPPHSIATAWLTAFFITCGVGGAAHVHTKSLERQIALKVFLDDTKLPPDTCIKIEEEGKELFIETSARKKGFYQRVVYSSSEDICWKRRSQNQIYVCHPPEDLSGAINLYYKRLKSFAESIGSIDYLCLNPELWPTPNPAPSPDFVR